jgi:hypothetical protein
MEEKRYFDKDLKKLILDYKLSGGYEEVELRTNLYNQKEDFHKSILFWSERDLVIIGMRSSIFSYEYLPLSIKRIEYNSIKSAKLATFSIKDIKLFQMEYIEEFIKLHEKLDILYITTNSDDVIEIIIKRYKVLAEFEDKITIPIIRI